jgi:FkbM family methyltransferase
MRRPSQGINRFHRIIEQAQYRYVRRKLAAIPRFTHGRISVFGWDLEYVDASSFLLAIDALVCKRWDDFRADSNQPLILDCGANVGISVLNYKHQWPQSKILAFEPDPNVVPVLRRNLERNNAVDVEIIEGAVWTCDGEANFLTEGADGSKLTSIAGTSPSRQVVKTVDFKRFLSDPVDLIKMNIEGAEYEVVPHLGDRLAVVKNMLVYCHIDNKDVHPFSRLLATLASAGFMVSLNSHGVWRDLIRQPPKLPNEFDQYILVAAWRGQTSANVHP